MVSWYKNDFLTWFSFIKIENAKHLQMFEKLTFVSQLFIWLLFGSLCFFLQLSNEKEEQCGKEELYAVSFFLLSPLNHTITHKYTALLESGKQKLWIGLVLDPEHGWQWSDAKPFRYLRWASGKSSLM